MDALVLLNAIYNIPGTAPQTFGILITTYFSFDEVSLKSDVKSAVIIFNLSYGRPLQFTLSILKFNRLSQTLNTKNPLLLKSVLTFMYAERRPSSL